MQSGLFALLLLDLACVKDGGKSCAPLSNGNVWGRGEADDVLFKREGVNELETGKNLLQFLFSHKQ